MVDHTLAALTRDYQRFKKTTLLQLTIMVKNSTMTAARWSLFQNDYGKNPDLLSVINSNIAAMRKIPVKDNAGERNSS